MTVKEAIDLLAYNAPYKAIGAHSGKKLFDHHNSEKVQARFFDCNTTDSPFFCELEIKKNVITNGVEYCNPIIVIWVSGK